MKKIVRMAMVFLLLASLMACGGGDSDGDVSTPSVSETDHAQALLVVEKDKTTFRPATVRDYVVHLSDGQKEVFVEKKEIHKIFWNDGVVGFHSVDHTKGLSLGFNAESMEILIPGQLINSTGGNFSFMTHDGKEYALITDAKWLIITAGQGMNVQRQENGLIYASVIGAVVSQKTRVDINTVTGVVKVTPYIVGGRVFNLVNPVVNEMVQNPDGSTKGGYRIAWNDVNSWYPAAGTLGNLGMPSTDLAGAARSSGAGMPYLVRPDGSYVAFNTDPSTCEFFINGVQKNVDADGLIRY